MNDERHIEARGNMIVRRFTDELNGDTQLEKSVKAAQRDRDEAEKAKEDSKLRQLYDDNPDDAALDFSASEIARNALEDMCNKMDSENTVSKLSHFRIGKYKKPENRNVKEIIRKAVTQDFSQLQSLVDEHEKKWRATHGKAGQHFRRICKSLNDHKKVFEVFPQQNMYAAVFCGSIGLIVHAAVNHDNVAETLAKVVADISVDATLCVQMLDVVNTQFMREQLSKLYAQVFTFYRDAIEWFVSSKSSKLWKAFDDGILPRFKDTEKNIENIMKRMYHGCMVGTGARVKILHRDSQESQNEIYRQRQSPTTIHLDPGQLAHEFLKLLHHTSVIEGLDSRQKAIEAADEPFFDELTPQNNTMVRAEAREATKHLKEFIVGDEGHSLFSAGPFWVPDPDVWSELESWMANRAESQTLWIYSHAVANQPTSARAAALNSVLAAWRTKTPIISHFCERPRYCEDDQTQEEAAMIGLVYSLINQLLQFNVEDDEFDIDKERFRRLNGTTDSFADSLEVFRELLNKTPRVVFCVIHQLNDLEWGNGADWCHDFLDILFTHQKQTSGRFSILLTTSGQSRVLQEHVAQRDHCITSKPARQALLD